MRRNLSVSVPLEGEDRRVISAFRGDPCDWLPSPVASPERGRFRVYLWAGSVGVLVDCRVGEAIRAGGMTTRRLRWSPLEDDRVLAHSVPTFDGDIVVSDTSDGMALTLTGLYVPPGGWAGGVADRVLLRRVARSTAQVFLQDVLRRLRDEEASTRRGPQH